MTRYVFTSISNSRRQKDLSVKAVACPAKAGALNAILRNPEVFLYKANTGDNIIPYQYKSPNILTVSTLNGRGVSI